MPRVPVPHPLPIPFGLCAPLKGELRSDTPTQLPIAANPRRGTDPNPQSGGDSGPRPQCPLPPLAAKQNPAFTAFLWDTRVRYLRTPDLPPKESEDTGFPGPSPLPQPLLLLLKCSSQEGTERNQKLEGVCVCVCV